MWRRILQLTSKVGSIPTIPVELIMHIMHFQDRCAIWKGCVWAFFLFGRECTNLHRNNKVLGGIIFLMRTPLDISMKTNIPELWTHYLSKSPYPGMPLVCILLVGVNLHPPAAPTSTPCKMDSVKCGYETLYDCICVPWLLTTVANYGG